MHAPLRALLCALPLLAYAASSPTPAIAYDDAGYLAYDDAGYLAYADRMQERVDGLWNEERGIYEPGPGGVDALVNAGLLLTHSVAAQEGHEGPARNDHRARLVAKALVTAPAFIDQRPQHPPAGSQLHVPGWSSSMDTIEANQHLVYDAEVVDGLVHAWKARRALGLPDETVRMIADRIHRVAHTRFWRWPTIRLNQVNWYALMYAADATVTGRSALLRRDMRAQLVRFVNGPRNFGPGLRFQYLPHFGAHARANVDSAEYANIVLSFLRFYNQARHAGMAPLPRAGRGLIRRWIRRAMAGYWTHAGYLNWDSGLGFERWHQAKKLGLAQEALIGIARTTRLQPGREWGRWAKWMFDRGLRFYERLPVHQAGLPDPVLFELFKVPQTVGSARLAAVRLEANAALAVEAGLGRTRGERPPSLYAFDPDIGRLAITTPAYNTAIVAVNQRAFPYGGIELARLFDGEQDVAAGIGGRGPAAFGLLVRDPRGRRVFSSQTGRSRVDPNVTPLRLTRAPSGTGASARTRPGKVFAGPFHDLRARGVLTEGRFRAVTSQRFRPTSIETRWRLTRLRGRARLSASALMPSWGGGARVVAVLRDGTRVSVRSRAVKLARVGHFEVISRHSGYTVLPLRRPPGAVARVMVPSPQSSAPDPGPTLAVELARGATWRRAAFAVRIVVARH